MSMSHKSILRCFLALLVLSTAVSPMAKAQDAPSILEGVLDMHDEGGYLKSSSLSLDGNLAVNNASGAVSYVYPISSFTIDGYPISTSLSYNGGVQYTSYLEYDQAGGQWKEATQNRPTWIVGVNGFAVQALHAATDFRSRDGIFSNTSEQDFNDDHFNWLIKGYEVCNRMDNMEQINNPVDQDVIHLMRADGSLLELRNGTTRDHFNGYNDLFKKEALYTGHYYENAVNANGYARVEVNETEWTKARENSEHWYFKNGNHASAVDADDYYFAPRTVYYYPGDGLEYEFQEMVVPFGADNSLWAAIIGGVKQPFAAPTVFYLVRIKGSTGVLTEFNYTRDIGHGPSLKLGRAAVESFEGHRFSYYGSGMSIEALGRTFNIRWKAYGTGELGDLEFPADTYTQAGAQTLGDYKSFQAFVSSVEDPEGRFVNFTYDDYTRIYRNWGVPKATASISEPIEMTLKNYRLLSVQSGQTYQELTYRGNKSMLLSSNYTGGREPEQTVDHQRYHASNVVAFLKKYKGVDASVGLQTTDEYEYCYGSVFIEDPTEPFGTTCHIPNETKWVVGHTITDEITGKSNRTLYFYDRDSYDNDYVNGLLDEVSFTRLNTVRRDAGLTRTIEHTVYNSLAAVDNDPNTATEYQRVPVSKTTSTGQKNSEYFDESGVTMIPTSNVTYEYESVYVRDYGNDPITPNMQSLFGLGIAKTTQTTNRPDDGTPFISNETVYEHLPTAEYNIPWTARRWSKNLALEEWFRLQETGEAHDYESYFDIPVFVETNHTAELCSPYMHGLVLSSKTLDPASSMVLQGNRTEYATVFQISGSTGEFEQVRGAPLKQFVIQEGGNEILAAEYAYGSIYAVNSPTSVKNAVDAISHTHYDYSEILNSNYTTFNLPEANLLDNNDQTSTRKLRGKLPMHEGSLADQAEVRKYQPGAGITTEYLETLYERTFLDQPSGTMDANGAYSQTEYDKIGRLKTAWLPFDFPSDQLYSDDFTGTLNIDLLGRSKYSRTTEFLYWGGSGSIQDNNSKWWTEDLANAEKRDHLIAARPWTEMPPCPSSCTCTISSSGTKKKGGSDQTQVPIDCNVKFPFDTEREYQAIVSYYPDALDLLQSAVSLSDLHLRLEMQSIQGHDIFLTFDVVHIDALGQENNLLSETYLFNYYGSTDTGNQEAFILDLNSIVNDLSSLAGGHVEFRVKNHTLGSSVEFFNDAQDSWPRLVLTGDLKHLSSRNDFTLNYSYVDHLPELSSTVLAKVDDIEHTEDDWSVPTVGFSRYTQSRNIFGVDRRVMTAEQTIGDPNNSPTFVSSTFGYTGLGQTSLITDQEGFATTTSYDAQGRPVHVLNPDASNTSQEFEVGRPSQIDPNLNDADYFGFCTVTRSTDEIGVVTEQYFDAFGRLKREIYSSESGGMNEVTEYEFDQLGRTLTVSHPGTYVDPDDHETRYCYNEAGQVKYKRQADLGVVSYAYDNLGNVRFSQTQEQADNDRLTFNQYDDLNRPILIGEAVFAPTGPGGGGEGGGPEGQGINFGGKGSADALASAIVVTRWTDFLNPHGLNNNNPTDPLTVNSTIWNPATPARPVPAVFNVSEVEYYSCTPAGVGGLPGNVVPPSAYVKHPLAYYDRNYGPAANAHDFEDVWTYPEYVRKAFHYDELPQSIGVVWGAFPTAAQWDALAPTGVVRNLKGKQAAIAYRQHGGEAFHYEVHSYDERGRLEALIRYTDNLGFDAVYYSYNSMNKVIAVTSAAPTRQHSNWYGYDHNGRMDKVWEFLAANTFGLGISNPDYPIIVNPPTDDPVIKYDYTNRGQISFLYYPEIDVSVQYDYNERTWPLLVHARDAVTGSIFVQELRYQPNGQIYQQDSWNVLQPGWAGQTYVYNEQRELTNWNFNHPGISRSQSYGYDAFGNRHNFVRDGVQTTLLYNDPVGPNRVSEYTFANNRHKYSYNGSGALTQRENWHKSGQVWVPGDTEGFIYGFDGLLEQYKVTDPNTVAPTCPSTTSGDLDWRYRYSPSGEREQKRLYYSPEGDECGNAHPWVYYQLDGTGKQRAVFHGTQTTQVDCGGGPQTQARAVYFYPTEYLSHGVGDHHNITTRPSIGREYKITDHLGSTRLVLDQTGAYMNAVDYEPFGKPIQGASTERLSYIDKEKDFESNLGDFGVRKYDDELGRFTSIDPLWEVYRGWSPYQYGLNSPMLTKDPGGKLIGTLLGGLIGAVVGGVSASMNGGDYWQGVVEGGTAGLILGGATDLMVASGGTATPFLFAAGASLAGGVGNVVGDIAGQTYVDVRYYDKSVGEALGRLNTDQANSKFLPGLATGAIGGLSGLLTNTVLGSIARSNLNVQNTLMKNFFNAPRVIGRMGTADPADVANAVSMTQSKIMGGVNKLHNSHSLANLGSMTAIGTATETTNAVLTNTLFNSNNTGPAGYGTDFTAPQPAELR